MQLIVHLFAVRSSFVLIWVACTVSEQRNSAPAPGSLEHLCSRRTHSRGAVRPVHSLAFCATFPVHLDALHCSLTSILFTRLYFDLQQTAVVTSMDINTNNSIVMERASRPADLEIQLAQVSDAGQDEEALHNDLHV